MKYVSRRSKFVYHQCYRLIGKSPYSALRDFTPVSKLYYPIALRRSEWKRKIGNRAALFAPHGCLFSSQVEQAAHLSTAVSVLARDIAWA